MKQSILSLSGGRVSEERQPDRFTLISLGLEALVG